MANFGAFANSFQNINVVNYCSILNGGLNSVDKQEPAILNDMFSLDFDTFPAKDEVPNEVHVVSIKSMSGWLGIAFITKF